MALFSFLCCLMWPLSLFLANTRLDFLDYTLPAALLLLTFYLYKREHKFYFLPLGTIALVEPKLALFPLLFIVLETIVKRGNNNLVLKVFTVIIPLLIVFPAFRGQTIFQTDYEAQQGVIRNTQLYPDVITARVFTTKHGFI